MGLFTNIGGQLKELSSLTTTVGGELKEINSLTANIGGQPKEIFTMLPKNIIGTYHKTTGVSSRDNIELLDENIIVANLKFPPNRDFKIKVEINITDGYIYKKLSSNKKQLHQVNIEIARPMGTHSWWQAVKCGSTYSNETQTKYTVERTYSVSSEMFSGWNVYAGRWAGTALTTSEYINYYNNDLLSFDYSIEFELV